MTLFDNSLRIWNVIMDYLSSSFKKEICFIYFYIFHFLFSIQLLTEKRRKIFSVLCFHFFLSSLLFAIQLVFSPLVFYFLFLFFHFSIPSLKRVFPSSFFICFYLFLFLFFSYQLPKKERKKEFHFLFLIDIKYKIWSTSKHLTTN